MSMFRTAAVAFLAFTTFPQRATVCLQSPTITAGGRSTRAGGGRYAARNAGRSHFHGSFGWSIVSGKNLVILEPPETDTHIAIVDSQASRRQCRGRCRLGGLQTRGQAPLKLVTTRPARQGWDERQAFEYETSPNERAVVEALALRAGSKWTAVYSGRKRTYGGEAQRTDWADLRKLASEGLPAVSRLPAVNRNRWMLRISLRSRRSLKPPCRNLVSRRLNGAH